MKAKTISMTEGNPISLILSFAAPMLIGNIFQQFYNLVDSTIVGKFVGAQALAAVGSTGTLQMLTFCLCMGMTSGAGIIISQTFGARNFALLRRTVGTLICVLSVISVVMVSLGIIFSAPVLKFLQTPDEILADSLTYFRIVLLGMPFVMAYNACSAILRSMGNSRTPLYMLILSTFLNIVLDLLFVIVFNGGVAGVAYATVVAQALSAAACLTYILRNRYDFNLNGTRIKPDRRAAENIFRTGIPAALQSSMICLGTMSVQRLINSFGTMAIAAYTASTKIDSLAIMVVVTMGMSLSVFCGQNAGAKKLERVKLGLYRTLAIVLGYCALIAAIMLFFGNRLLLIFLDPSEAAQALDIGTQYLKIIGIAYFMAGIMRCYLNVVHGAGDVNVSLITGLVELAVRIIASYILVRPFGLTGLWIAIPISWGIAAMIPVIRYYSGKWKNKILI